MKYFVVNFPTVIYCLVGFRGLGVRHSPRDSRFLLLIRLILFQDVKFLSATVGPESGSLTNLKPEISSSLNKFFS